jgi:hypothetical protein
VPGRHAFRIAATRASIREGFIARFEGPDLYSLRSSGGLVESEGEGSAQKGKGEVKR